MHRLTLTVLCRFYIGYDRILADGPAGRFMLHHGMLDIWVQVQNLNDKLEVIVDGTGGRALFIDPTELLGRNSSDKIANDVLQTVVEHPVRESTDEELCERECCGEAMFARILQALRKNPALLVDEEWKGSYLEEFIEELRKFVLDEQGAADEEEAAANKEELR